MSVSISVIVPTTGRGTLAATLESISSQLNPVDELILVWDVNNAWSEPVELARTYADTYVVVDSHDDDSGRGNKARKAGIELATGSHLAFMDDDDCYLPGALEAMRTLANPTRPVIFRMRHMPYGNVMIPFENLWGRLEFGNVGTPCFVVPNIPDKLGEWRSWDGVAGSDFRFIKETCDLMGEPIFRREIIAIVQPHHKIVLSSG